MLQKPEEFVANLLVVFPICGLWNGDVAQLHILTTQRRLEQSTILLRFFYSASVSFCHRHRNPGNIHTITSINESRNHPTSTTTRLERVILTELILDGATI